MKKLTIALLALALACIPVFALTGCGNNGNGDENAANQSVVIGTLATEDILPMWVAESEGAFTANGVQASVQTFQSATELIAAVTAGDVQMAMTDPMVSASIYASGTDVQVQWVTLGTTAQQGRFGIMTSDSSIKSLKDLAGVEIGVGSNTILEYVMDTLLENAGVAAEDIKTSELQKLPVRFQAMASGQVKAAALPASLLALGESQGFTVVADDTAGDNISQSVMIARSDFAQTEAGKAAIDAIAGCWNASAEKINANPADYRSILVEKANLSEDIVASYELSEYPQTTLPTQEQVDNVLSWMKKKGYLAEGISYDSAAGTFSGK